MKDEPKGVRGWLLFLCIILLYLTPAGGLLTIIRTLLTLRALPPGDKHGLVLVDLVATVFLIALAIAAGLALRRARPGADRVAKVFLIFSFAYGLLSWLAVQRTFDLEFGDPGTVRPLVPMVMTAVWYAYLVRSRRVRNTYGPPAETADWLAATRSLSDAVRHGGRRLPWWVGAGFFMGALPTSLLFTWSWSAVWLVIAGVPLSLAFVVLLSRGWKAWQSVVAWGLAAALAGMAYRAVVLVLARSVRGFEFEFEGMETLFQPLSPRPILVSFMFGALFLAGLFLAVHLWGVRLWSLAAGAVAGQLVAEILNRAAQGYAGLRFDSTDLLLAFSGILSAAFLYAGVFLHADRRLEEDALRRLREA